jgi:hypothetical protein
MDPKKTADEYNACLRSFEHSGPLRPFMDSSRRQSYLQV